LKRIDSLTFESSLLALSQKSLKESSLCESSPVIDPTLVSANFPGGGGGGVIDASDTNVLFIGVVAVHIGPAATVEAGDLFIVVLDLTQLTICRLLAAFFIMEAVDVVILGSKCLDKADMMQDYNLVRQHVNLKSQGLYSVSVPQ
jgi:hypothetical protein